MSWKPKNSTYMLRTCNRNYTSHNGFKWPDLVGFAETPIYVKPYSWNPEPECGNGLHGYVEGKGSGNQLKLDGLWQIVEVEKSEIVMIGDKAKVPQCNLVFCGSRKDATDFLVKQHYLHPIVAAFVTVGDNEIANVSNFGTATAGNDGTATVGYQGTATAGTYGTATAGDYGTATAGHYGTATAGDSGTATAEDYGTATAGDYGTATAGDYGTATAGDSGTATAGDSGTATAGYSGTATAGNSGIATAGDSGTATAGIRGTATAKYLGTAIAGYQGTAIAGYQGTAIVENAGTATVGIYGKVKAGIGGTIQIRYYNQRLRIKTGYVGEKGLLPDVFYRLNENFEFKPV